MIIKIQKDETQAFDQANAISQGSVISTELLEILVISLEILDLETINVGYNLKLSQLSDDCAARTSGRHTKVLL